MIYFTSNDLCNLQCKILAHNNQTGTVLNRSALESCIASCRATFDGQDLYPTDLDKICRTSYDIITMHPFSDGNKRVGIATLVLLCQVNNIRITLSHKDLIGLGFALAQGHMTFDQFRKQVGRSLRESFETHKELNSKLFENNKLKQDVRKALLDIVVTFVKDLEENEVPLHVVDVWLIGSNASFNYTSKSDIDLHIITNSSELSCDPALLKVVYNYAKAAFNRNHDITIKDLPVEVYIQDCESTVNSNGIYSVIDDCWVKEPKPITITYPDMKNLAQLEQLVATYKALDRNDLDAVTNLIDLTYKIRKEGQLEGEFSDGNLSFKEFRNLGYLDDLKELRLELESKELTLEKLK